MFSGSDPISMASNLLRQGSAKAQEVFTGGGAGYGMAPEGWYFANGPGRWGLNCMHE